MKNLMTLVFVLAISLPVALLGAYDKGDPDKDKEKDKKVDEKSVPAPSTLLLLGGAAAAFAGVRKYYHSGR